MSERQPMLIDIASIVGELYPDGMAPSVRTIRERMDERGCIIRDGRQCFTTRTLIEKYKRLLCQDTALNSSQYNAGTERRVRRSGSRAASCLSVRPMARLAADELSTALRYGQTGQ